MTQKEKDHKIKLISLILLVENEKVRRGHRGIYECIAFGYEFIFWLKELKRVSKTHISKPLAIVGNQNKEIIIDRNGKQIEIWEI